MTTKASIPAVLVCCGSFNPITNAHIEMLRTAKNHLEAHSFPDGKSRHVVHAFVSPVNDGYKKPGLAPFPLRKQICQAAFSAKENNWITLHEWEGRQDAFVPTFIVMDKIREELKTSGAAAAGEALFEQYLVCGSDLLESFYKPGAWGLVNLKKLFEEFKMIIMSREGSPDPKQVILEGDVIKNEEKFPGVEIDVKQYLKDDDKLLFAALKPNATSSTLVRNTLKEKGVGALKEMGLVPEETLEILGKQDFYPVLSSEGQQQEEKKAE